MGHRLETTSRDVSSFPKLLAQLYPVVSRIIVRFGTLDPATGWRKLCEFGWSCNECFNTAKVASACETGYRAKRREGSDRVVDVRERRGKWPFKLRTFESFLAWRVKSLMNANGPFQGARSCLVRIPFVGRGRSVVIDGLDLTRHVPECLTTVGTFLLSRMRLSGCY